MLSVPTETPSEPGKNASFKPCGHSVVGMGGSQHRNPIVNQKNLEMNSKESVLPLGVSAPTSIAIIDPAACSLRGAETLSAGNRTSEIGSCPDLAPVHAGPFTSSAEEAGLSHHGKRPVRGRYTSVDSEWILELDLDFEEGIGQSSVRGAFYFRSEQEKKLFGTFGLDRLLISTQATRVFIRGVAVTDWRTRFEYVQISIPRVSVMCPPGRARMEWMDIGGTTGAVYVCALQSRFFPTPNGGLKDGAVSGGMESQKGWMGNLQGEPVNESGTPPARATEGRLRNLVSLPSFFVAASSLTRWTERSSKRRRTGFGMRQQFA